MRLAAFLLLLPALAAAEPRIEALAPGGARMILTYGFEWVEVTPPDGPTRGIVPPPTCVWNGAAYHPGGDGFAMSARCVFDPGCDTNRAGLWRTDPNGRLVYVAHRFGRLWTDPVWSVDGESLMIADSGLTQHSPRGVGEAADPYACDSGPTRLVSVRVEDGRLAAFDLAPAGWTLERPLAAAGARVAAAARSGPEPEGFFAEWGGDGWLRIGEGAARLLLSADLSRSVQATCGAGGCTLSISGRAAEPLRLPEGAGLALSPDGGALAIQSGGRLRIVDLASGAETEASPVLSLAPPWGPEP